MAASNHLQSTNNHLQSTKQTNAKGDTAKYCNFEPRPSMTQSSNENELEQPQTSKAHHNINLLVACTTRSAPPRRTNCQLQETPTTLLSGCFRTMKTICAREHTRLRLGWVTLQRVQRARPSLPHAVRDVTICRKTRQFDGADCRLRKMLSDCLARNWCQGSPSCESL